MSSDKYQDFTETLTAVAPGGSDLLNVLVVDDSAIVRQVLVAVLSEKRGFRVTVAADPIIAMEKMKKCPTDVILLDLEMLRMDGMSFLEKIMSQNPVPVVVCSGLTGPRTEKAIRALEFGAVDIITKPKIGLRGFLEESAVLLEDTVRAAATARVNKFRMCGSARFRAAEGEDHCHRGIDRRHRSLAAGIGTDARELSGDCGSPTHARGFHGSICKTAQWDLPNRNKRSGRWR